MFLSTLRSARGLFGVGGRQKTVILLRFCLLCGPQALDFGAGVDKIRQESPFFVYIVVRERWIWPCEQTKTSRKADFGFREHCILP